MQCELDPSEVVWAAGLLEGEGCFSLFHRTYKSGNTCPTFAIHCEMTDEDVIRKLYTVFRVGTICTRENKRADGRIRKRSFIWSVQNKRGVKFILQAILPHMCLRRTLKIKEMLALMEEVNL